MSTGTITFEAANGDELVIAHTGYFEMGESVTAFYAWAVESGTGRFDGAVGSGETIQELTFNETGTSSEFSLSGMIAYDASSRSQS
jgi:hypothetical protein